MTKYTIQKFNINKINTDPGVKTIFIMGKRSAGKTCLIKDILWNWRNLSTYALVSNSSHWGPWVNIEFDDYLPATNIHHIWPAEKNVKDVPYELYISNIVSQRTTPQQQLSQGVVIVDNVFLPYNNHIPLNRLTNNKDVYNLHTIISTNCGICSKNLKNKLKINANYVFIYNYAIMPYRLCVFEYYREYFPSFEVFCSILDAITCNGSSRECLVIDTTVKSDKLEDRIFWYKANIRPPFKVGPPVDPNIRQIEV